MIPPTVNIPDIQIAAPVSFLYAAPQLSGPFIPEYVPLSAFHSVVYLIWSAVMLGFG